MDRSHNPTIDEITWADAAPITRVAKPSSARLLVEIPAASTTPVANEFTTAHLVARALTEA